MEIKLWINDKQVSADISPDMPLLEFLRSRGCYSVKRGCETSNCGLYTVWLEGKPILSCTFPTMRAAGNLCRCTGYMGQMRAIHQYLTYKKEENQHA